MRFLPGTCSSHPQILWGFEKSWLAAGHHLNFSLGDMAKEAWHWLHFLGPAFQFHLPSLLPVEAQLKLSRGRWGSSEATKMEEIHQRNSESIPAAK
jgi:hypothetical protein